MASPIVGVVRFWGTSFTLISTLDLPACQQRTYCSNLLRDEEVGTKSSGRQSRLGARKSDSSKDINP